MTTKREIPPKSSWHDHRVPSHDPANRPAMPDWKELEIPVLSPSDFLSVPSILMKPYTLSRKVWRAVHRRILKSDEMTTTVWDYKLCFPLKIRGIGHFLAAYGFR